MDAFVNDLRQVAQRLAEGREPAEPRRGEAVE
jgi:hypothetical protein